MSARAATQYGPSSGTRLWSKPSNRDTIADLDLIELSLTAEVGYLATIDERGGPHIVPFTFAGAKDRLVSMVDHKPKTTNRLQRLRNIEKRPRVSALVDNYDTDWSRLWWVRFDGVGHVVTTGPDWGDARALLAEKYVQYRDRPPEGPAILIDVTDITQWRA